jgi:transcription elongation factor B subunit 1
LCIILAVVWAHDVMVVGKVRIMAQTRWSSFSDISGCLSVNASTGRRSKARWGCEHLSQPNAHNDRIMDDDAPKYVKLVSATGTEVYCERSVAVSASATMAAMLTSESSMRMREAEENVVRLPDISGPILEKVVQYMHYKTEHADSVGRLPEFAIEPEIALELLVAANYLNC